MFSIQTIVVICLAIFSVQSASLRKQATVRSTLSDLGISSPSSVVKELAAGTPASLIHLKITKLIDALKKRHTSVSSSCETDMIAVRKSSHVQEALDALDAADQKTLFARQCLRKNNETIIAKQSDMSRLMKQMVLPDVYTSLAGKQTNITIKLKALADKHEAREKKFRDEQQAHTDSHEAVDSVLDILQSFYSTKGMAPPTTTKGSVGELEIIVPQSLLELVSQGKKEQSAAAVKRILNDGNNHMRNMVQTNHPGEVNSDKPKKKKVAGTLWKAMWMLKNTMLNDTAIMHERHQLRNDHSKSKIDRLSNELEDIIAQTKVLREQDISIQKRVDESMSEAKEAEINILKCKEQLSEANVAQISAEDVANRKKARIAKMEHLCKTQLASIEDELQLGKYVISVIENTVSNLHSNAGSAATGSAATGGSSAINVNLQ
jgi:hypothetical protein